MEYERNFSEAPECRRKREQVCEAALERLKAEIENLSEAGATARIEAMCEVLRIVGGRR